jgi:hypothetical protein
MSDPAAASASIEAANWIQAGGLALFASAVWWEVRSLRQAMGTIRDALAVLLDRVKTPNNRARTSPGD